MRYLGLFPCFANIVNVFTVESFKFIIRAKKAWLKLITARSSYAILRDSFSLTKFETE